MAPAPEENRAAAGSNPFPRPSDKANGAVKKASPFPRPADKAANGGGSTVSPRMVNGKPPLTPVSSPFPRPSDRLAAAAAAAAGPPPPPVWRPTTDLGREAEVLAARLESVSLEEAQPLVVSMQEAGLLGRLGAAAQDAAAAKGSAVRREDAMCAYGALIESGCPAAVSAVVPALPVLLDRLSDKDKGVREAAQATCECLVDHLGSADVATAVPLLLEAMAPARTWQVKSGACRLVGSLAQRRPAEIGACLTEIVQGLSQCMVDAHEKVKVAAKAAMLKACGVVGNRDLEPFIPALVSCIVRVAETPEIVHKMSATTFVQAVESPALAIMVPFLVRALRERNTAIKRKACIIIHNMSKLVYNPAEAAPFLPRLLPEVKKVSEEAADPEMREVAADAYASLLRVKGHDSSADLAGMRSDEDEAGTSGHHAGEELCNCEFSLAYGGRILLKNANLHLVRGRRYGLCGANGVGKSTLMRAISRGQLDGFPPRDVLRTVYVEHDIDASEAETPVVEFVYSDRNLQDATHPAHSQVEQVLSSVGFSDELQRSPVATLSGGWKMKLALARAMLMRADILLLDEPTNHLDVANVAWLEQYLVSRPDVSSMIVSHDSGFLDNVCTDIIHYENKQLVLYPGNLSAFVQVKPEARTYYELQAATLKFTFPRPGFLEGIKMKSQPIAIMTKVSFTYPGADKPQLIDVSCRCSLGSRIAVLGANGAGKSTLIKLLCGETEPDEGTVWKHPNLRIAYVAQHAFHHIEEHLKSTPADYFWWRFASGEDRENAAKVTRKMSVRELQQRDTAIAEGKLVVEALLSRRKAKKDLEYEVKWWGLPSNPKHNKWYNRAKLEELGCGKMVNDFDSRLAASKSYKPLSKDAITKHLDDFGMDPEITNHNAILGLSGGQKVKLVLAAAMWNNPHMLVLDEPTNYLDRDSLGALASAIMEFQGCVVMISHNSEFTSALCNETWFVEAGRCAVSGGALVPTVGDNGRISPSPSSLNLASKAGSMASGASTASLISLDQESNPDDAGLTPEQLEERVREKAALKEAKAKIAAEKLAAKEIKKKLRYDRKH